MEISWNFDLRQLSSYDGPFSGAILHFGGVSPIYPLYNKTIITVFHLVSPSYSEQIPLPPPQNDHIFPLPSPALFGGIWMNRSPWSVISSMPRSCKFQVSTPEGAGHDGPRTPEKGNVMTVICGEVFFN